MGDEARAVVVTVATGEYRHPTRKNSLFAILVTYGFYPSIQPTR
jgi:hypothetical protein